MGTFRPKLGLALGGGGLLGIAHVGVLQLLNLAGIKPDYIAGTSMGGIIGAAYAAGTDPGELETEILRVLTLGELPKLLDAGLKLAGLISGKRVHRYLINFIGDITFDQLQTPLTLVATDLISGLEVQLQSGSVVDAVRATISIPGVFEPMEIPPYRLVDGGIVNSVPADVVRAMGADIVLAVDVMPYFIDPAQRPRLFSPTFGAVAPDLIQTGLITIASMTELNFKLSPPDLLIRPKPPQGVTFATGFKHASKIITNGFNATEAVLPQLKKLIGE